MKSEEPCSFNEDVAAYKEEMDGWGGKAGEPCCFGPGTCILMMWKRVLLRCISGISPRVHPGGYDAVEEDISSITSYSLARGLCI